MDTSDSTTATRHTTEVGAQGGLADAPSWPAIAAWGGGLIQLALGAGAITSDGASPAIRVAGILLVVIGAGAIGWGAATLARGRIVVPRLSIAGSLAGILAAAGAMALDPTRVSVFAVAAAIALLIAVALGCALELRRAGSASFEEAPGRADRRRRSGRRRRDSRRSPQPRPGSTPFRTASISKWSSPATTEPLRRDHPLLARSPRSGVCSVCSRAQRAISRQEMAEMRQDAEAEAPGSSTISPAS